MQYIFAIYRCSSTQIANPMSLHSHENNKSWMSSYNFKCRWFVIVLLQPQSTHGNPEHSQAKVAIKVSNALTSLRKKPSSSALPQSSAAQAQPSATQYPRLAHGNLLLRHLNGRAAPSYRSPKPHRPAEREPEPRPEAWQNCIENRRYAPQRPLRAAVS